MSLDVSRVKCRYFHYSALSSMSRVLYRRTVNGTLLESVPRRGEITWTVPVVASVGTVVVISDLELTLNVAGVPLKVTLVAPVRKLPRILTVAPTLPEVGSVSTNWPSPTFRLKTVPSSLPPHRTSLRRTPRWC